jgi:hypothetical protein
MPTDVLIDTPYKTMDTSIKTHIRQYQDTYIAVSGHIHSSMNPQNRGVSGEAYETEAYQKAHIRCAFEA